MSHPTGLSTLKWLGMQSPKKSMRRSYKTWKTNWHNCCSSSNCRFLSLWVMGLLQRCWARDTRIGSMQVQIEKEGNTRYWVIWEDFRGKTSWHHNVIALICNKRAFVWLGKSALFACLIGLLAILDMFHLWGVWVGFK